MNKVDDDLSALKHNIDIVNKKMAINDKEIEKLENCVQVRRHFILMRMTEHVVQLSLRINIIC